MFKDSILYAQAVWVEGAQVEKDNISQSATGPVFKQGCPSGVEKLCNELLYTQVPKNAN